MTIKETYEAKQKELVELKAQIEAGDAEAVKTADTLMNEIEELKGRIAVAEKAQEQIKAIGNATTEEKAEETGLKSVDFSGLKDEPGSKSVQLKTYSDTITSATQYTYDKNVVSLTPALRVRDLFGQEQISTNALTYYVLGSMEGSITTVAEGAVKPQVNIPYTAKTVALTKIAAFFKETDELLLDNAFLESAIRNRGIYEFRKAVDAYLVSTLLGTSGVQVGANSITFDNILAAKLDVAGDTGYTPEALLINPGDLATLLQTKDQNKQYLLGGPAYGAYGNGTYSANPRIWGMDVVESSAVPSGKCIVGAFKAGAAVVTKAGEGFRVEVTNSDQNDFIYNRITVRLEERLLEAVRVPAAFETVGSIVSG